MQDGCLRISPTGFQADFNIFSQSRRVQLHTTTDLKLRKRLSTCIEVQRGRRPTMISQTLEGRYVDKEKLVKLLKELFGVGNFQVKVGSTGSMPESFQSPVLTEPFHVRT